jgi:hypothetical protein
VLADLGCTITDGGKAISDFRVIGDQGDLFGLVASVPTVWGTLSEVAADGAKSAGRITAGRLCRVSLRLIRSFSTRSAPRIALHPDLA